MYDGDEILNRPRSRTIGVEGSERRVTPPTNPRIRSVGLPKRAFLFTLDQIAMMVGTPQVNLVKTSIYFYGLDQGTQPKDRMMARDILSGDPSGPDWRVAEPEFVRWMRGRGFKYYERGWVDK